MCVCERERGREEANERKGGNKRETAWCVPEKERARARERKIEREIDSGSVVCEREGEGERRRETGGVGGDAQRWLSVARRRHGPHLVPSPPPLAVLTLHLSSRPYAFWQEKRAPEKVAVFASAMITEMKVDVAFICKSRPSSSLDCLTCGFGCLDLASTVLSGLDCLTSGIDCLNLALTGLHVQEKRTPEKVAVFASAMTTVKLLVEAARARDVTV